MDASLVYRKTRRGATELATHGALSAHARAFLILLDGQRTIGDLADLFGAEQVERVIGDLEAHGFAKQADPDNPDPTTTLLSTSPRTTTARLPENESLEAPFAATGSARRAPIWIAVGLALLAAGASGYWFVWRPNQGLEPAIAAVRPSEANGNGATAAPANDEQPAPPTPEESSPGAREVPISGLPAIKPVDRLAAAPPATGATAGAPVSAAPVAQPAPASPPAATGSTPSAIAAAGSAPVQTGAAAEPAAAAAPQPRRTLAEAQAGKSPASFAEKTALGPSPSATQPPREPIEVASNSRSVTAVTAANDGAAATSAGAPPTTGSEAAGAGDQVAALTPPVKPQSGPVQLHPRKHDPPDFPGRAMRAHITEGHVLARVWINAEGKVEQVDIVKAEPPRVFDEEVKRALTAWTYDPPGRPANETVQLDFKP